MMKYYPTNKVWNCNDPVSSPLMAVCALICVFGSYLSYLTPGYYTYPFIFWTQLLLSLLLLDPTLGFGNDFCTEMSGLEIYEYLDLISVLDHFFSDLCNQLKHQLCIRAMLRPTIISRKHPCPTHSQARASPDRCSRNSI